MSDRKFCCDSNVYGMSCDCDNQDVSSSTETLGYNWSTEFPEENGLFWFYGYRYGKISVGRKQKPELALVRVSKNPGGHCIYVSEGTFMFRKEVEEPHFTPVQLPNFPKL